MLNKILFSATHAEDHNTMDTSSDDASYMPSSSTEDSDSEDEDSDIDSMNNYINGQLRSEKQLPQNVFTVPFPSSSAGASTTHQQALNPTLGHTLYYQQVQEGQDNIYAPFSSRIDWEIAQWAKMRGPGSTAVSELLSIDGVCIWFNHHSIK